MQAHSHFRQQNWRGGRRFNPSRLQQNLKVSTCFTCSPALKSGQNAPSRRYRAAVQRIPDLLFFRETAANAVAMCQRKYMIPMVITHFRFIAVFIKNVQPCEIENVVCSRPDCRFVSTRKQVYSGQVTASRLIFVCLFRILRSFLLVSAYLALGAASAAGRAQA